MSHLSPSLYPQLKAAILADPTLSAYPNTTDGAYAMLPLLNVVAAPDWYVWRTDVTKDSLYFQISGEATTWEWTTFKAQSTSEQGAWMEMFSGSVLNMALLSVRTGVEKIFGSVNAQTIHVKAISKRKATRAEKIFAVGLGLLATPATMVFEGMLDYTDVDNARHS